jgi:hypothetical protein
MKARLARLVLGLGLGGIVAAPTSAWTVEPAQIGGSPASARREYSVLDAAKESLFGDPYAEPDRWQELSLGTFFTEGWDEPWISPPTGGGSAPRQGWLNAFDGVFYRLGIATFGWTHDGGDGYNGGLTLYTPFSRRFELREDVPFIVSNRGSDGHRNNAFGDFLVTPRFILSETRDVTQSFNVAFRTPTGDIDNGNGVAAITPSYEFWANWWRGLVVRGGAGLAIPYNHDGVREAGARTNFLGNLSAGYYFTPHDLTPVGDLVGYVATNLGQLTDNRGPSTTTLTFTPGFRTHMGRNWYLLGGVEVPATSPKAFDYQVLGGLMKVF